MLQLKNITKKYADASSVTTALDNINLTFRKQEFVSILGPSGCGKTSLLNIIGGLDQYTSGDLVINNVSTKHYSDKHWDSYRNHTIGFVFQSYNLITHQSVFKNVELALTLTGISKKDRKKKVIDALKEVGLEDHMHKKPNQLSGGQMQRVAIARALVNSPDIILADEPTGALDSENSELIMQLLKKISRDKLVIVVTHNPELAQSYSTRIIKLCDGKLVEDSDIYNATSEKVNSLTKKQHTKMSFFSALKLSFSNLLTKKTRTIITTIASSVGIIGIALILSVSSAVNGYIADVERDTLMSNPLTIQQQNQDFSTILSSMLTSNSIKDPDTYDASSIYVNDTLSGVMNSSSNDTKAFYQYIIQHEEEITDYLNSIKYTYNIDYTLFTEDGRTQINPSRLFTNIDEALDDVSGLLSSMSNVNLSVLSEMIDNEFVLNQQYELVGSEGSWPTEYNEVVLVVDKNNEINKLSLYLLGLISYEDVMSSEFVSPYHVSDFIGMKFKLVNTCDFFIKTDYNYTVNEIEYPIWQDIREGIYDQEEFVTNNGIDVVITGVVKPKATTTAFSITGLMGHTAELTEYLVNYSSKSEIVLQQQNVPDYNVLTGVEFTRQKYNKDNIHELVKKVDDRVMSQIYDYISEELQTNEEFASTFRISDNESFISFFNTLTIDKQQQLFQQIVDYASIMNYSEVSNTLEFINCNNVDVNVNNIVTLLPIIDKQDASELLTKLLQICGTDYTSSLFQSCTDDMKNLEINETTFLLFLQRGFISGEYFDTVEDMLYQLAPQKDASYSSVLSTIGYADFDSPASISFYAKDFESRACIEQFISNYNNTTENKITYTDVTKSVLNIIHSIITVVSCVLIAFISISLLVSSLMIGVITYVSVLERKKEIGILRAMGASRNDIKRIFNAETAIIGFTSGCLGVGVTLILNILLNKLLLDATNIPNLHAALLPQYALLLIFISMTLTFISGLMPANVAAKLNPVESLRSD